MEKRKETLEGKIRKSVCSIVGQRSRQDFVSLFDEERAIFYRTASVLEKFGISRKGAVIAVACKIVLDEIEKEYGQEK